MDGVTCIAPGKQKSCESTKNWFDVIHALQASGFVVGKDIFSAPYDFRMGPEQFLVDDYPRLKGLVEKIYDDNGGKPVVFLSVSYGAQFGGAFLAHFVDDEWKDKYIDSWISLSGAFNGAPMAMRQLLSGGPVYGLDYVDIEIARDTLRSWPAMSWLVPTFVDGDPRNEGDRVIMYTDVKNYTLTDVPELLDAGGAKDAADMKRKQRITTVADPGVKVHW